jgi:antitoxin ChpS
MHTTNLRKVGGSVMLAVPPAILDILHLQAGAAVGLAIEGDRLVIQSQRSPVFTLDELLAQCDPSAPVMTDDQTWLENAPVGEELL